MSVVEYNGKEYPSLSALATEYNLDSHTFRARLQRGFSIEEALTKPVQKHRQGNCVDHNGTLFPSQKALCVAYGIPQSVYLNRIRAGWTMEAALTTPIPSAAPVTDNEGNTFSSFSAMAEYYGISSSTLRSRLAKDMGLEEALTRPVKKKTVIDPDGVEFKDKKAMAEAHGVRYSTFQRRYCNGQSLEQALSDPPYECRKKMNPGGNKTVNELCQELHISRSAYFTRKKNGIPLEKNNRIHPVTDYRGIEYPSLEAMLRHYKVKRGTYQRRVKFGWTPKECLLGRKRKKALKKKELIESRKRRRAADVDMYFEHLEMLERDKEISKKNSP